jgi:hypothetical protein
MQHTLMKKTVLGEAGFVAKPEHYIGRKGIKNGYPDDYTRENHAIHHQYATRADGNEYPEREQTV